MRINKYTIGNILAWIFVPVCFTILGFLTIYFAARPVVDLTVNAGAMLIAKDLPSFDTDVQHIYDPTQEKPVVEPVEDDTPYIPRESVTYPVYNDLYGNLSCARLEFDAPVIMGNSNQALRGGLAQELGSFIPGWGRPILLCGHNTSWCRPLEQVAVGDVFTFSTSYGTYEYTVRQVEIAHKSEAGRLFNLGDDREILILYTCYPFYAMSTVKNQRLFVIAERTSGLDIR